MLGLYPALLLYFWNQEEKQWLFSCSQKNIKCSCKLFFQHDFLSIQTCQTLRLAMRSQEQFSAPLCTFKSYLKEFTMACHTLLTGKFSHKAFFPPYAEWKKPRPSSQHWNCKWGRVGTILQLQRWVNTWILFSLIIPLLCTSETSWFWAANVIQLL